MTKHSYSYDQGQFMPSYFPYKENDDFISFEDQAKMILNQALTVASMQDPEGIYITYSANYTQTDHIESVYNAGDWEVTIGGGNQAKVMKQMMLLLKNDQTYKDLQGVMRIAPVTTIPKDETLSAWKADLTKDLNRMKVYLTGSNIIFGWMNQDTKPRYSHAIATKASVVDSFPEEITDLVQDTLSQFAKDYKELPAIK